MQNVFDSVILLDSTHFFGNVDDVRIDNEMENSHLRQNRCESPSYEFYFVLDVRLKTKKNTAYSSRYSSI